MTTYINLGPYNFEAFENIRSPEGIPKPIVSVANGTERHEGEWREGKMNGRGALFMVDEEDKSHNGQLYQGYLKDGMMDGHGRMIFPDGSFYIGGYKEAHREGTGTLQVHGGGKYQGEWKNDCRHGQGTERFPTGNVYKGDFLNN